MRQQEKSEPLPAQLTVSANVVTDAGETWTRVSVGGEIDVASAAAFEERIQQLRADGGPIRLDLAEVTFMDSSGLAVLIRQRIAASESGQVFDILSEDLPPVVARLFDVSGVNRFLA